jgi:glycosyltransferase involved in cell wall biosynthesis
MTPTAMRTEPGITPRLGPEPRSTARPRLLVIQSWISFRGAEHISVETAYLCHRDHEWDTRLLTAFVDRDRLPPHGDDVAYVLPPRPLQALLQRSRLAYLLLAPLTLTVMAVREAGRADLLNPHNPPCQLAAAVASRLRRRPVVWTCNGMPPRLNWSEARDPLEWITWKLARSPLARWAARRTNRVVSASRRVSDDIRREFAADPEPLYQPVDWETFARGNGMRGRSRLGIPTDRTVVTVVGQLHRRKEQLEVIKALPELRKAWPDLHLVLAGTGPAEPEYREYVAKAGLEGVVFAGFLNRSDLADLYAAADLNVVPYWRDEGCPATPFEALAAGTPSVVARRSGADELIAAWDAGWIWDPETSIASVIDQALRTVKDGAAQQLIERGRNAIKAELTWSNYAAKLDAVFRSALATSSAQGS